MKNGNGGVASTIEKLGPWFHNVHLPDGTQTKPDHFFGDFPNFKWALIATHLPKRLRGWRVLDIGCNAGFYSIELARRGAEVLGIDVDPHYLRQAKWTVAQWGLQERITLRQMQVYDLARLNEQFDLVIFMGVLYHLRYPLLGLDIVCQKVKRLMVFQTLMLPGDDEFTPPEDTPYAKRHLLQRKNWPKLAFVEKKFAGDMTNWWVADRGCFEGMLRSAGMKINCYAEREIAICSPDDTYRGKYTARKVDEELQAATGTAKARGHSSKRRAKAGRSDS